ncbi:hypothetical protein, partial [Erwinia amylovora]|uniref:hypothetical protein n=1 Tax=Erwinia amylovora TaxID=552 RepID=UPI0020BEB9E9
YFTSTTNSFTLTALTGGTYVAITPGDTAAATSGTAKLVSKSAISLPQAGKNFQGILCDRGLVVTLSAATDLSAVIWEPA